MANETLSARALLLRGALLGPALPFLISLAVLLPPSPAGAITATWLGGIGDWDDAARWDVPPNFPCNGQGGATYDVIFGSGGVTLNLDCTVDSYTHTGATLNGSFELLVNGVFTWTGGTLGGSASILANGGANISGNSNKSLDGTHVITLAGGTSLWDAGNIALGNDGATFENQSAWNIMGPSRSMTDTSNTGSFLNDTSGVMTVTLDDSTRVVTFSPGSLVNDGALDVVTGIVAFSGDGVHSGSFTGNGSFRASGGSQTLGPGANVTIADLDVSGGTLDVVNGANYAAGNTDISGGTFLVSGALDVVSSTTASQSGGTLAGPGTFATTGGFAWTGGTMAGSGTTRIGNGVALSGNSTKSLDETRTVVFEAGTGSWSAGNIGLGNDGATVRNEAIWNVSGSNRSMSDTGNTGTFVNDAGAILNVDLIDAGRTITLSPGTVQNDGTVNVNLGTLAFSGSGTHSGTFAGTDTVAFASGVQTLGPGSNVTTGTLRVTGGTLNVDSLASYAAVSTEITAGRLDVIGAGGTITSQNASHAGGTLGGDGEFETVGFYAWSGGTMDGSGTTRVGDGLALSGSGTKSLSGTRTLVLAGGVSSWSAGNIGLGNTGATLRNEAAWLVSGSNRSVSDTGNTGSFENTSTGLLDVDLDNDTRVLTFSPGSLQNDGSIDVGLGIVAMNGTGIHGGAFTGTGTFRVSGGDQVLAASSSVAIADFEVTGGTLEIAAGADFSPGNTDLVGGTLSVVDALDTVVSGTALVQGGRLEGAGTFETTGLFQWSGGTMGGSGTTRVFGGLDAFGNGTKSLDETRQLIIESGSGTWSAGTIALGNDGATMTNRSSWTITGTTRGLSDVSDSGAFLNDGSGALVVDLDDAARTLTISTGAAQNAGLLDLRLGTLFFSVEFTQTAGRTLLAGGIFESAPLADFQGGTLEGSGLVEADVSLGGTLAPGPTPGLSAGQIDIDGSLLFQPGGRFEGDLLGPTRSLDYDTATVTGGITLDGMLAVELLDGYRESVGTSTFVLLEDTIGTPIAGSFANVANGERVFTADLDSFVVHYGPASVLPADSVILSDFVQYEIATSLQAVGTATGGQISFEIGGIVLVVDTTPGQTAAEVAAAIVAAINGNAQLRQQGIVATLVGAIVRTNGEVTNLVDTDDGIVIGPGPGVPGLDGLGLWLLTALLVMVGAIGRLDESSSGAQQG